MFTFGFGEVIVIFAASVCFMFLIQPFISNIVVCGTISALIPLCCFVIYKTVFRQFVKRRHQKFIILAAEFLIAFALALIFRLVS